MDQNEKQQLVAITHAVGAKVGFNLAAVNWAGLWPIIVPWLTSFPVGPIVTLLLPALTSAPAPPAPPGNPTTGGGPTITPKP